MKQSILILIALMAGSLSAAGEWPASAIPASLRTDAYAVIRSYTTEIVIREEDKAIMRVTRVVTVLDEKGKEYGFFSQPYDKLRKIRSATVRLLDAEGKEEKRVPMKDMNDVMANSSSFATDDRFIFIQYSNTEFPYTVVMEYELELSNLFLVNTWQPQSGEHLSVEQASITVDLPLANNLNFHTLAFDAQPNHPTVGNRHQYAWRLSQLPALKDEVWSPAWEHLVPTLYLVPAKFEAEGISGQSDSWASLGAFFYQLNDGRQSLPADLREKVHKLADGLESPREKAEALYRYTQQNTRYVSIQLGIGGWQTFDAKYVHETGYGDCKALTNFMKSMLMEVGIESHVALVRAGDDAQPIQTAFPSNQFNHVILCLPFNGDTTWLECTSATHPFGYLGDFTEGRHVLLMTPKGGKLTQTPAFTTEINYRTRTAHVTLKPDGSARMEVLVHASGFQETYLRALAYQGNRQAQEKYVRGLIALGSYELLDFSLSEGPAGPSPSMVLTYTLESRQLASAMGKRLFLPMNMLESPWPTLDATERKLPIEIANSFIDTDTVYFHLPAGFVLEAQPGPAEKETVFGKYEIDIAVESEQEIRFVRRLEMSKMRLPASYSEEMRSFLNEINRGDKQKMVLNNRS